MSTRPWAVTGGAGFLGSHVIDAVRARGTPVLAIDDLSAGRPAFLAALAAAPDFQLARLDVRDVEKFTALLRRHNPAVVSHLAAVERFWWASTGEVYAPAAAPHAEDGPLAPFNVYGLSKLRQAGCHTRPCS